MSNTPDLNLNHVGANQDQKTVTINEAFDNLDASNHGKYQFSLAGLSGDETANADAVLKALWIDFNGAASGAVNYLVPATFSHIWFITNNCGQTVTVKPTGGSGVAIADGAGAILRSNGTDCENIAVLTGSVTPPGQALPKTLAELTGAGGTTVVAIGATVDETSVEVYVSGILMIPGREYNVTESVPASGNYDQLTPLISEIFPSGAPVDCFYYT